MVPFTFRCRPVIHLSPNVATLSRRPPTGLRNSFKMRDLSELRNGWDEREMMETELLRRLTLSEGIGQLDRLYREFRSELEETEELYRPERLDAMAELQRRLLRLNR